MSASRGRWRRRTIHGMALSSFRRNALAISVAACVGACSDAPLIDCSGDSPTLQIDTSSFPLGVVTTEGECTQVHCTAPEGNGCLRWVGERTGVNQIARCKIVLSLPDGQSKVLEVSGSGTCESGRKSVVFSP